MQLVLLATSCKKIADVEVLDCVGYKYSYEDFEKYMKTKHFDFLAISAFSNDNDSAIKCADIARKVNKDIICILGGSHVYNLNKSGVDDKIWNHFDFMMFGECEESLPLLMKKIVNKEKDFTDVKGLIYKPENGSTTVNEPDFIDDLDSLPIPDWRLIDIFRYPRFYQFKGYPFTYTSTTRGCPYSCTFCAVPLISQKKFRKRSVEHVMKELKLLKEIGIKEVAFWDDNLTLDRDRTIKLCDAMVQEKLGLKWTCPNGVRIDKLDQEMLDHMYKAGCYSVSLGIESGVDKILQDMKKSLTIDKVRQVVPMVKKSGIQAWGFFIIGYPTETKEDILTTIKFAKELDLDRASFHLYQPAPGTEAAEIAVGSDFDFNNYVYSECNYSPPGMSVKELKSLQKKAIVSFHLRPKIMLGLIKDNFSFGNAYNISKLAIRYLA